MGTRPGLAQVLLKGIVDGIWDFNIRTYFSDVQVLGHEHVPLYGPCIIVANHNNQFVDAMLLGAAVAECCREVR